MLILSCSKDLHPVLGYSNQTSEILRTFIIEHHICNKHLPFHISQLQLPPLCSVLDRVCSEY